MKCPLLTDKNYGAQLERHMATGDCIQAECAWWIDSLALCTMAAISYHLKMIESNQIAEAEHDQG